jgi:hypothetical protein
VTQIGYPLANTQVKTPQDWSAMAQNWLNTGVIKGKLNDLLAYADSTGMQVKVKSGQAFMQGHFYQSDSEELLPIAAADSSNPRIDRIIIRLDYTSDSIQLGILQGIPAVSPVAPALTQNSTRWEISLAQVYVGASVSTIVAGNITDERFPTGILTPTLLNGWVSNSIGSAFFWKDNDGIVNYQLVLKNGATGINTTIMVFPPGYIPDREYLRVGYCEGTNVTDHSAMYHISNIGPGELKLMRDIGVGNSLLILYGSFKAVN